MYLTGDLACGNFLAQLILKWNIRALAFYRDQITRISTRMDSESVAKTALMTHAANLQKKVLKQEHDRYQPLKNQRAFSMCKVANDSIFFLLQSTRRFKVAFWNRARHSASVLTLCLFKNMSIAKLRQMCQAGEGYESWEISGEKVSVTVRCQNTGTVMGTKTLELLRSIWIVHCLLQGRL